jgi:hypothetical protein
VLASSPTTCSSSSTRSERGRREPRPEPPTVPSDLRVSVPKTCPQDSWGLGNAIPNVFFSSDFRCCRARHPRGVPPCQGRGSVRSDKSVVCGEFSGLCRLHPRSPPCSRGTRQSSKRAVLQVFKPSPGLEPGTASLPWRIRPAARRCGKSACYGVFPATTPFRLPDAPLPPRALRLPEKP